MQIDFSNAFNLLDRSHLLREAASRCPSAFNYLRYAYATAAPLFLGDGSTIQSTRGTHQGCPLCSLGFALGIQSVVEDLHKKGGLLWTVSMTVFSLVIRPVFSKR